MITTLFEESVVVTVMHLETGEYFQTTLHMNISGLKNAQEVKSAITYYTRTAIAVTLGLVAPKEDDDANAASSITTASKGVTYGSKEYLV